MKNWKVDVKLFIEKNDKTERVKKEFIVEAESLADVEYILLPVLKGMTKFEDSIEIISAKKHDMESCLINDLIMFDTETINEDRDPDATKYTEGMIYENQENFIDNTYMFEAVVEFFEPKDNGEMKKSSQAKIMIPSENVQKATAECMNYLKDTVTEWKIKDVKTTKISTIIMTEKTYNSALERKALLENGRN